MDYPNIDKYIYQYLRHTEKEIVKSFSVVYFDFLNIPLDVYDEILSVFVSVERLYTTDEIVDVSQLVSNAQVLVLSSIVTKNLTGTISTFNGHLHLDVMPMLETIDSNFMSNSLISSLIIENAPNLTDLGDRFLSNATNLQLVDMAALNVSVVGNNFLYECSNLTELNLPSITVINSNFLHGCKKLRTVDLFPLTNVIKISSFFMSNTGIVSLDVSPLSRVTFIGSNFLADCQSLTTLNIEKLINLQYIGNNFMNYCGSLQEINFTTLVNIKLIGDSFMTNCKCLKSLDLSSSTQLRTIQRNFLAHSNLHLGVILPNSVTTIGINFLYSSSIYQVDFNRLTKLEYIESNFMANCFRLHICRLNLSIVIRTVNDYFLANCRSLKLVELPKILNIGYGLLSGCMSLETKLIL